MKNSKWFIICVALAIMASTTVLLLRLKSQRTLGEPGVKVGPVRIFDETGKVAAERSVLLPAQVLNAVSQLSPISTNELNALPKDTTFGRRRYQFPDQFVTTATVVLMGTDRSSIHQPQYCLTGQGWSIDKTEAIRVNVAQPVPYELPVLKLTASYRKNNQQINGVYVYWFVADGKMANGPFERMASMAKSLMQKGVLERWAYVSYFSMCTPGQEDATFDRLKQIIAASVPEFQLTSSKSQK